MTRDDIIRLAQEAGFIRVVAIEEGGAVTTTVAPIEELERFAALVAAAEREKIGQEVRGFFAAARSRQQHLGLGYVKVTIKDVDDLADSIWINRTVKDHLTVEPMLRTAQQVNPTGKESLQVELQKAYADWSTAFATADKAWKDAYKADKERDAAAKRVSSLNAAIRARET
jgi:hypothetical protein